VRWKHALAGGLFVAVGLALTKWGLGEYLSRVPSYSKIYGAFATVPILLLWMYISWLIVLFGAVIAAYLPSLMTGVARRSGGPGWGFQLAAEVLQALAKVRDTPARGRTAPQLAARLRVDTLQLAPVLTALRDLDWVGQLGTRIENEEPRYVLLFDPAHQPLRPLLEKLLLKPDPALAGWWADGRLDEMTVVDLLVTGPELEVKKAAGAVPSGASSS
jgi:membrane protein